MKLRSTFLMLAIMALPAGAARAQQPQPSQPQPQQDGDDVPKASRPPAGMCRIWLDKVPAKQQPAPTDCPTAVKNKPANAKVLFGDDYVEKGKKPEEKEPPFLKKFTNDKRKP
ncbi:MAG: hypothetical protein ABIT20_03755 [Gemmatimonadaceae bacterium]